MTKRVIRKTVNFEEILTFLKAAFPELDLTVTAIPLDDMLIMLSPTHLLPAARILVAEFDFDHLSTISGDDDGTGVQLLYHFWNRYGITLSITLAYDKLSIPTLTGLLPGATLYEREVYEMLGVTFEGHPNLAPLLSSDDWAGEHILRK